MDATIVTNISSNFRINADPFAQTCRTYSVWWRRRKHRLLKKVVEDFVVYANERPVSRLGDSLLWLLDLQDGFLE